MTDSNSTPMPTPIPDDLRTIIDPAGWSDEPSYRVWSDDDTPSTVHAFFPFDPDYPDTEHVETVVVSSPRFRIVDRGEDHTDIEDWIQEDRPYEDVDYFDDERVAYRFLRRKQTEHGLATITKDGWKVLDDEDDNPRFILEDVNDVDEVPPWFDEVGIRIGYRSTDGWRGHTTFDVGAGWHEYAGGWVTGYPDQYTQHKMDAVTIHNALHQGTIRPPVPILWCFGVTSNVFSTVSDVFIPDGADDIIQEWLNGLADDLGVDDESFGRAFS